MNKKFLIILSLSALFLLAAGLYSLANSYRVDWWTLDGGSAYSAAGDFALHGTLGQPDAGGTLSGGEFTLQGGFWTLVHSPQNQVYLPAILR